MKFEGHNKNELSPERKAYFEGRIWEEVNHLAETRTALKNRQSEIYKQLQDKSSSTQDQEERTKLEDEYWGIPDSLAEVEAKEAQLQELLINLESNSVTELELTQLFPDKEKEEKRLSKAKQRRLEELKAINEGASGLYFDSMGFGYDLGYWDSHSAIDPNRLTSGRHAKGIKGSFSTMDAAGEFFYRTSDTHGGKVGHGKETRGTYYVTKSGKRIRKR